MLSAALLVPFAALSWAQQEKEAGQAAPVNATVQQPSSTPAGEISAAPAKPAPTEWLYGEVNSVDIANKSLVMNYLDYDTDMEKQATVYTDAKTIFENAKSLEDIKPQDMLSVDYLASAEGKNLAVSISVEKPESVEDLNMEGSTPPAGAEGMKPAVEAPANPPVKENQPGNDTQSAPPAKTE